MLPAGLGPCWHLLQESGFYRYGLCRMSCVSASLSTYSTTRSSLACPALANYRMAVTAPAISHSRG